MPTIPEERIRILVQKYLTDNLSEAEGRELGDLAIKYPRTLQILDEMESQGMASPAFLQREEEALEKELARMQAVIHPSEDAPATDPSIPVLHRRKSGMRWLYYTATAVAVIGGVFILCHALMKSQPVTSSTTRLAVVINDTTVIVPVGNKTARPLTLPDGTKVWLNAASTLRYPTVFAGKTRDVRLTGEAYFDVAKDAQKPFTVKAQDIDIQVLGTAFNINAYTKENIRTFLSSGKVNVKRGNDSCLLSPGQFVATGGKNKWMAHTEAHPEEVLGWKEGELVFNGAPLSEVLKSVARWYDVDPDLQLMKGDPLCWLRVNQQQSISNIVDILNSTGSSTKDKWQVQVEGRKLIARPLSS
ncbi:MAG TPA: FecR domain-containing protein [Puia sp.]|jgi:ferric-dicitrate binding protein FerR (iron transport regulator)